MKVSQHNLGTTETHILVPILRNNNVSVVLESGLEEGAHYTATLFFDSQYITSTNFCEYSYNQKWLLCFLLFPLTATYAVQDISITVRSNDLKVQCLFAEGSAQDICTVILVLNGVEQRRGRFNGEITFSNLPIGSYTVLVFDSEPEINIPALKKTVVMVATTYGEIETDSHESHDTLSLNTVIPRCPSSLVNPLTNQ